MTRFTFRRSDVMQDEAAQSPSGVDVVDSTGQEGRNGCGIPIVQPHYILQKAAKDLEIDRGYANR